jgi:hypothetical protein
VRLSAQAASSAGLPAATHAEWSKAIAVSVVRIATVRRQLHHALGARGSLSTRLKPAVTADVFQVM